MCYDRGGALHVQAGELIANRYELQRELGEGGMATVWLAMDRTLERPVAIKFLDVSPRERAALTEQFLREARIAAAVRHRNVIQILDFGTHGETPFMAMEALAGETMADRFDRSSTFELREVVEIAVHCLDGLAAVHEAGIVHRDLKPENIFLARDPTGIYAKLLDFGISKAVDKRSGRRSAIPTEAGRIIGTPEYMSPEQARGLPNLDGRTDLYSLGIVMYEALTGRLPFDSEHTGELLLQVVRGGATDVAQLVPAVGWPISEVVAKAMSVDREQRYASAVEMRNALVSAAQPLLTAAGTVALPVVRRDQRARSSSSAGDSAGDELAKGPKRARARSRKARAVAVGAAVATFALLIGAVVAIGALREPASGEAEPRYIVVQGAAPEPAAAPVAPVAIAPPAAPSAAGGAQAARAPERQSQRTANAASARRGKQLPASDAPAASAGAEQSQALAAAFDRQKGPVVECLNRHLAQAGDRVQMAVRLTLANSGRVDAVEVLPAEVAATTAGACIAAAVRGMRFGAQPAAISIRVPLTARRGASEGQATPP